MFQIDSSGSVATMPTPVTLPGAAPGWFAQINPSNNVPTVVSADWLNSLQSEIINTVQAAGITPSKTTNTQLLAAINTLIARSARIKLTAPLTLYVSPSGNDANPGTSPAAAFQTIQAAYFRLMNNYDSNGYPATIQLANGTYTQGLLANQPPGLFGVITILGNAASPGSVIINSGNGVCVTATAGAVLSLNGLTLIAAGTPSVFSASGAGIVATYDAFVYIQNLVFGACSNAHMLASASSTIAVPATAANQIPYTISGSAPYHAVSSVACVVSIVGANITLTGTPAFSGAFVIAQNGGYINFNSTSFTGSATGVRYLANTNGMVLGTAGVSTYFPGSSAGSTATGGLYG